MLSIVSDHYVFFSTHLQSPASWPLQIVWSSPKGSCFPPSNFHMLLLVLEMPWANYIPTLRPRTERNLLAVLWRPFSKVICSFLGFFLQHAVGTHMTHPRHVLKCLLLPLGQHFLTLFLNLIISKE